MIVDVLSTREEPPGAEIPTSLSSVFLHKDPILRTQQLKSTYSRFITAAYRGVPVGELEDLTEQKEDIAIAGIMKASHLLVATKGNEIVGLLAYTIATPETHPDMFARIHQSATKFRRRVARETVDLLRNVDAVFVTDEMIVAKEYRGNGVSHTLRQEAFKSLEGKVVAVAGEILSRSSIEQRLKLDGPTVWAGQLLNPNTLPTGHNATPVISAAYILGREYIRQFHENSLASYNRLGIIKSDLFDTPARPATEPVNPTIRDALSKIITHRSRYPKSISAGVAVTFYSPTFS